MTPEEIAQAYEVVAQDVKNMAAEEAAKVGNSQRSLGTLAERVASPSGQTNGLANYTYNRLMRPTLDATTTALVAQGKSQALNTYLTNELLAAKGRYEDAKNAYTVAGSSSGGSNGNNENGNGYNKVNDVTFDGRVENYGSKGNIINVVYDENKKKWVVSVSNGNGGFDNHEYTATSKDDALKQYRDYYKSDGTEKSASDKYIDRITNNGTQNNTPLQQMLNRLPGRETGII